MNSFENNAYFWQKIDSLCLTGDVTVSNAKGTSHQVYHNLIYPVNFGSLNVLNDDGDGVKCFKGTDGSDCKSIAISANLLDKNVIVKLLIGCTSEEEILILQFLNQTDQQKAVLIRRENVVPQWAISES